MRFGSSKRLNPVCLFTRQSRWLDAKADISDMGHRKRLRTLGRLIALSITNASRLAIELPDLFFRWMLQGDVTAFEPTVDVRLREKRARSFWDRNIIAPYVFNFDTA